MSKLTFGFALLVWILSASTPSADFSRVPVSGKRAYGRVRETPIILHSAVLKPVSKLETKDPKGNLTAHSRVWSLSLLARDGTGFILYFSVPLDQSITNLNFQRRPNLPGSTEYRQNLKLSLSKVPIGITSCQLLFRKPGFREIHSKFFRSLFSARLSLGSKNGSEIIGQIILVTPDVRKSFISGAIKAQVVGF